MVDSELAFLSICSLSWELGKGASEVSHKGAEGTAAGLGAGLIVCHHYLHLLLGEHRSENISVIPE